MDLNERIIRDQDILSIYAIDYMTSRAMSFGEIYSDNPKMTYSEVNKYILENEFLLKDFSISNFFNFLYCIPREDLAKKQKVIEMFMKRLENEPFFCQDIDTDFFMKPIHSVNYICSKFTLGTDNINKIRESIIAHLDNIADDRVENLLSKGMLLTDVANLLKYYDDGIFNDEKFEILERMSEKSENSLSYVNFGLFQDEILALGENFITYISKFPRLSTELVTLYKNNPQLFKILSDQIQSYESYKDNLDEIEVLIDTFTKKSIDINIENNVKRDEIIEWALLTSNAVKKDDYISVDYTENFSETLNDKYDEEYEALKDEFDRTKIKIKEYEEKISLINSNESDLSKIIDNIALPNNLKYEQEKYKKIIEKKLNIYINKRFSISISDAKIFLEEYASDLENVELDESKKRIFYELKEIFEMENIEECLDDLYDKCEKEYKMLDILRLKTDIAKEFAKDYVKSMNKVDSKVTKLLEENPEEYVQEIDVNGKKIKQIKLNGKFDMLVHSIDPGFINERPIDSDTNFAKLWTTRRR